MSNDTQHYTNLEILHSLVPKLDAISPIDFVAIEKDYEAYSPIIDAIATAYRSGYGRGQKGRSFLIGEKKKEIKAENGANYTRKIRIVVITKPTDFSTLFSLNFFLLLANQETTTLLTTAITRPISGSDSIDNVPIIVVFFFLVKFVPIFNGG